ncbi:hypothetical protein GOBAR_DD01897 [Gossypium barbadense]|nr:hypothetical protein GOBAR_DD01897 [Gossypium barbadense]
MGASHVIAVRLIFEVSLDIENIIKTYNIYCRVHFLMSTSTVKVSGEKVKAMWDKRLTEIFCDICIKEILKEWKAWKKLKGEDTGLGWNPIKITVDASDDWWESRLQVVPEAQKFRTSGTDLEFEGKLDQMFMGIVATSDKAWAPSSADNISQATSSLTPVMDPYGIPQAVKVLNSMLEEVMSIVENYSGDESGDEREKKEILQRMECFNRLFVVASSSVQLYYEKYILRQPCMDSKQSGETWIREILDDHESCCMINFRMSKMVILNHIGRYHLPDFRRGRSVSDFMKYEDINWGYENIIDSENAHGRESDDDNDDDDDGDDDG